MKDLIDSIRIQLYQRISSPLFGSFVIAWLCWNHRYLFILFSDAPIENRLQLAHNVIYPTSVELWLRGVIWPSLSCVGFILIYPYPSKWLFSYWHKRQIDLKKKRDEIEGETLLTKDESRKIIRDSIAIREKYEQQIEKLAREIDTLKSPGGALMGDQSTVEQQRERILALEDEIRRRDNESEKRNGDPLRGLKDDTKKGVLQLLTQLAQQQVGNAQSIAAAMKVGRAKAELLIDAANARGLILRPDGTVPGTVGLSAAGRECLDDHGLLG